MFRHVFETPANWAEVALAFAGDRAASKGAICANGSINGFTQSLWRDACGWPLSADALRREVAAWLVRDCGEKTRAGVRPFRITKAAVSETVNALALLLPRER